MLLNFELGVLESLLVDSRFDTTLLVVLQDLEDTNWNLSSLRYPAQVPQITEQNYQIGLELVMVIYTRRSHDLSSFLFIFQSNFTDIRLV